MKSLYLDLSNLFLLTISKAFYTVPVSSDYALYMYNYVHVPGNLLSYAKHVLLDLHNYYYTVHCRPNFDKRERNKIVIIFFVSFYR